MAIQVVDVDSIVTDEDLNTFLGGQVHSTAVKLAPEVWQQRSKPARQYALDRILQALRTRVPPIAYSDLAQPEELVLTIMYGAAEHMYQLSITEQGDIFDTHRQLWMQKFADSIAGLVLTLADGEQTAGMTFSIERR